MLGEGKYLPDTIFIIRIYETPKCLCLAWGGGGRSLLSLSPVGALCVSSLCVSIQTMQGERSVC